MDFEAVKAWLAKWQVKQVKVCRLKAVLAFGLAPLAIVSAVACLFGILWAFTYRRFGPNNAAACLWISVAFVPVMFVGNRLVPRGESLMEKRMREGSPVSWGGRNRAEVFFNLLLWILFAGPRLINWGIDSLAESRRLREQDTHGCAAMLWLMLSRMKKVPFENFQTEMPWLDVDTVLPQVMRIAGVVRLETPPAGLSMTDDLRKAIKTGSDV